MARPNIKARIIRTYKVFSELLKNQNLNGEQLVTGAVAGDVAVSGIKLGDSPARQALPKRGCSSEARRSRLPVGPGGLRRSA